MPPGGSDLETFIIRHDMPAQLDRFVCWRMAAVPMPLPPRQICSIIPDSAEPRQAMRRRGAADAGRGNRDDSLKMADTSRPARARACRL